MKYEYPCTECGGDAHVGMSNWIGPSGRLIGKKERLCLKCAKKRKVPNPIHPEPLPRD